MLFLAPIIYALASALVYCNTSPASYLSTLRSGMRVFCEENQMTTRVLQSKRLDNKFERMYYGKFFLAAPHRLDARPWRCLMPRR
jgi:hypothetical protein